jgi:hypothetical protein
MPCARLFVFHSVAPWRTRRTLVIAGFCPTHLHSRYGSLTLDGMGRISRGFRLVRASWEVLKADRELLILPVISFIGIALVAGSLFAAIWTTNPDLQNQQQLGAGEYAALAVLYFFSYLIGIFFNAAVVAAASIRLQGGDPTVKDGLRAAWSKIGRIVQWAALAATVGLILRTLEQKAGFLGRIVIAIVGAAWSAITFFVVPVLLFEEEEALGAVKRSATLFKQRWGEQFVGNATIVLAIFIVAIPIVMVAYILTTVSVVFGIAVGVLAIGALAAIGSALSGVFNAALYRYATSGETSGAFSESDLQGAFHPKR